MEGAVRRCFDGACSSIHTSISTICASNIVSAVKRSVSSVMFCLHSATNSSSRIEIRLRRLAVLFDMTNDWEAVSWVLYCCGEGIMLWVVRLWFQGRLLTREGIRDTSGRADLWYVSVMCGKRGYGGKFLSDVGSGTGLRATFEDRVDG